MTVQLYCGDCLDILPTMPAQSVDAVITDPPYPEISRDYGRLTEAQWWDMMMGVCTEVRRILKPTGSAVFILQPNSRKVGSMRGWLWEFMAWVCRDWNMVQDVWWWNSSAPPTVHTHEANGLMRPSQKACVWAGGEDCYRRQANVLLPVAESTLRDGRRFDDTLHYGPSGMANRVGRAIRRAIERGGSTPYNVLPITNKGNREAHGATTPLKLADWWTRYIVPPGGVVCDPFMGSGTMGLAALARGHSFIGIEKMPKYHEIAQRRINEAQPALLDGAAQ